jgi:hypothetical protein
LLNRSDPTGDAVKHIRSIAKYLIVFLGVFGAGAVVAGFFLSSRADRPDQNPSAVNAGWVLVPPTTPLASAGWTFGQSTPEAPEQSSAPVTDRPNAETTGSSAAQRWADTPNVGQIEMTPQRDAACNVAVCRRFYRSFDEATCTYRPYGGGPPQLCNR